MKTIYTSVFLFLVVSANAQSLDSSGNAMFNVFQRYTNDILSSHLCKKTGNKKAAIVTSTTFDTLMRPIFGKVIVGANDLINQGSAYSLSFDNTSALFALNYSLEKDKDEPKRGFFNVGFTATSTSKTFQLFSKNEWQRGIGLVFGVTNPLSSTIRFDIEDCTELVKKRTSASVYWLNGIRTLLSADTAALQSQIGFTDNFYSTQQTSGTTVASGLSFLPLQTQKDYNEAKKQLTDIRYIRSLAASPAATDKIQDYVDSLNTDFERQSFTDFNYSLWWYNINLRPEYRGVAIYDTTAAKTIGIQKKDFLRIGVDANLNYLRNGTNLFFVQFGFGLSNTNYLEGRKSDEIQFLITPVVTPDSAVVSSKEATVVSDYDKYKKQFLLFTPNAGFNWFWGEKRILGYELFASTKIGFKAKQIPFDNLFTVRTGFLVSLNGKTDLAKSTFAFLTQWDDLKFRKPSIKDNFTFNIRIGIPFNF